MHVKISKVSTVIIIETHLTLFSSAALIVSLARKRNWNRNIRCPFITFIGKTTPCIYSQTKNNVVAKECMSRELGKLNGKKKL